MNDPDAITYMELGPNKDDGLNQYLIWKGRFTPGGRPIAFVKKNHGGQFETMLLPLPNIVTTTIEDIKSRLAQLLA